MAGEVGVAVEVELAVEVHVKWLEKWEWPGK